MTTIEKARLWLSESFDEETRTKVQQLIDENGAELEDSFYKELEFGTGGTSLWIMFKAISPLKT